MVAYSASIRDCFTLVGLPSGQKPDTMEDDLPILDTAVVGALADVDLVTP